MKDKNLELTCKHIGKLATNDGRCKKNEQQEEYIKEILE